MREPTLAAETPIGIELIHALLVDQYPVLAGEPIEFMASGWDNEIHRIGADHASRLPRREIVAPQIENEQRWLPELAPRLPLPIPVPVHRGTPALGYPWPWSVVPWFPGVTLAHAPELDQTMLVDDLVGFLNALHVPAPPEAPSNPVRGVPLSRRDRTFRENAGRADGVDVEHAVALWSELITTPEWDRAPVWLHGDLHPLNLLVHGGRLSAVIDWIDVCAGDPASDLAVGWMIFDEPDRGRFVAALDSGGRGTDEATWSRARAWALHLGLAFVAHSADDPTMRRLGVRTLDRVLS